MRLRRKALAAGAIAVVLLCLAVAGVVVWRAERALGGSARSVAGEQQLAVRVARLAPIANPGFEVVSAPGVFAGGAVFHGKFYLTGPGGLFVYSGDGLLEHLYRTGIDLPPVPLGRAVVATLADARQPELLMAARGEGVLLFDGQTFREIRPAEAESRQVTAILPLSSGRLLLGTAARGLLIYDGRTLQKFHATTSALHVTALAGNESDLWVGTLDAGALHWRGGQGTRLGESEGLPDARVESIAVEGGAAFLGTPVGVAEVKEDKVTRVLAPGSFAHALLARQGRLVVGGFESGIRSVALDAHTSASGQRRVIAAEQAEAEASPTAAIEQFVEDGETRYAVAAQGLLQQQADGHWRSLLRGSAGLLTDRDVSALMPAADGRLWVGYFDRGLDILAPGGGAATHIENEQVFCVNRIVEDPRHGGVAVATANGLVLFDRNGSQRQVLRRSSGLIADHVTDIAVLEDESMALATPAGITFLDAGGAHSLYAFEGLVNNHVYALGSAGKRLIAGTLGGISLLDDGVVRRNLTTSTSALKHNWITSMSRSGADWLVGTYGAGILRMNAAGEITATEATRTGMVVNPTAMTSDARMVLAGTLGQGLLVGDAGGTRWTTVTAGLPSANVTAVAIGNGIVYVGTDNGLVRIAESRLLSGR